MERFDPDLNCWETLPPMSDQRWAAVGATISGCLYLCGGASDNGHSALRTVERFDPLLGRWEVLSPMLEGRGGPVCAAITGKIDAYSSKALQCVPTTWSI